jgi:hypothetical protein
MKTNITQYSDAELSLICYNEEGLYKDMRRTRGNPDRVRDIVDELFIYTPEQFDDLIETIDADLADGALGLHG